MKSKSTALSQPQQIDAVYIVRALAIIGVLLVHTSAIPVETVVPVSKTFGVYNFINIFNKFGTPTFIFLSAFVLFHSYFYRRFTGKLVRRFYQRRLLYVLLPYLIFSLGYYVMRTYYMHGQSWEGLIQNAAPAEFFFHLLTGKAFYHLYFIFISVQFYLLFPALLWILQRYPALSRHLVWMGIVLQWAFVLMNHWSWQYDDKGSLAISYLSNYFLGTFCGIHYESIKSWVSWKDIRQRQTIIWLVVWLVWGAAAAAHVYVWHQLRVYDIVQPDLVYEGLWHLHSFLTTLVLSQAAHFLLRRLSRPWVNALLHLGMVSFGIYLLHAGLLSFYFSLPAGESPLVYHPFVAGGFLWALFGSWLIVGLSYRLTGSAWVLFGSLPSRNPVRQKHPGKAGPLNRVPTLRRKKMIISLDAGEE